MIKVWFNTITETKRVSEKIMKVEKTGIMLTESQKQAILDFIPTVWNEKTTEEILSCLTFDSSSDCLVGISAVVAISHTVTNYFIATKINQKMTRVECCVNYKWH